MCFNLDDGERALASGVRPRTPDALHGWLLAVLGIEVPRTPMLAGNASPFDYLYHAYFEPGELSTTMAGTRDAIVWANRGGGKTFYAAVATVLDLLFKPGIEVKCLGGSLEQSSRMHEHIRQLLERPALKWLLETDEPMGKSGGRSRVGITDRRVVLRNGSRCEILAQSQTAVRGTRPQKLRCDEVELFDPEVWEAAQLVTRSKECGERRVIGGIEALSTMHEPHGLMMRLLADARTAEQQNSRAADVGQACDERNSDMSCSDDLLLSAPARRLFRWCALDVLERCPPARDCDACVLLEECRGTAKRRVGGHLLIDDAAQQKRRVDQQTWEAEMLCLRPRRSDAVLPEFDERVHVVDTDPAIGPGGTVVCGMDFGFRAPTVVLWAVVGSDGVVRIVDELVRTETLLESMIDEIRHGRGGRWPTPSWVGVDPAGRQRSEQTGVSCVTMMRRASLSVKTRVVGIEEGLGGVRARLRSAAGGEPRLFVHRRCVELIRCLQGYHYPRDKPEAVKPVKDGHDHAVDALRYLVVNLDRPGARVVNPYGEG